MKWWAETTDWRDGTRNGVYLLNDSKSKMLAYRPPGGAIKVFKNPIAIETRGRKFVVNPQQWKTSLQEEQPEGRVFQITGSRGDQYQVTENAGVWSCNCSGFRFRGQCRHVKEAQNA